VGVAVLAMQCQESTFGVLRLCEHIIGQPLQMICCEHIIGQPAPLAAAHAPATFWAKTLQHQQAKCWQRNTIMPQSIEDCWPAPAVAEGVAFKRFDAAPIKFADVSQAVSSSSSETQLFNTACNAVTDALLHGTA
jgi:hypothetical protein